MLRCSGYASFPPCIKHPVRISPSIFCSFACHSYSSCSIIFHAFFGLSLSCRALHSSSVVLFTQQVPMREMNKEQDSRPGCELAPLFFCFITFRTTSKQGTVGILLAEWKKTIGLSANPTGLTFNFRHRDIRRIPVTFRFVSFSKAAQITE
jgi:hypothetical protein